MTLTKFPINSSIFKLFFLALFLSLASCQSVDVRGQYVSDEFIEEINSKKLNQDEIVALIGTPTYVPEYSPNHWYYIQRSLAKRAWFDPKVIEQRIVKIIFTNQGKFVETILLSDMYDENITIESNYTKTHGTEQTNVQKFVKNFGRFVNKKDKGKKKREKSNY